MQHFNSLLLHNSFLVDDQLELWSFQLHALFVIFETKDFVLHKNDDDNNKNRLK